MICLKLVRNNVGFLNQNRRLYMHDNTLKMKISQYCKNGQSTKNYSTQRVERSIPKLEKPSLRLPKDGSTFDAMAVFLLCIPVSTFFLGIWQIRRKKWKENLIDDLMRKTQAPAIELPSDLDTLKELEYRRIHVKGVFDHSGELYLGPRSCLVDGESKSGGKFMSATANGTSGYYVVTPFILSDSREKILVNRGWVPFPKKNPKKREEGQVEGEVEIEGILRVTEPRQVFVPDDKPSVKVFLTRNVEKMAEFRETKPVFLDATVESTVDGGPLGGQTRASLRNEHLSYILTWFGLSAATGVMWYMKYLK